MMKHGKSVLFLVLFAIITYSANAILMLEERYYDGYEETFLEDYEGFERLPDYCLDVLFIGSSNIFMNVSPLDIYDKFGIKAYNLATPMQTLQQSYFQLQYAFKSQKPQKVLLDCCSFTKYYENGEAYAHMAYDAFPSSRGKYAYLKEFLPEEYDERAFKVPFLKYHNRWNELDIGDFDLSLYNPKEDFMGYSPAFSIGSGFEYEFEYPAEEAVIYDKDVKSLEQIVELCESKNCELILIKTPLSTWNRSDSHKMQELCDKYGLQYWEMKELPGLEPDKDFCDNGSHLNDIGAQKLSHKLGERLGEQIEVNSDPEHNRYFDNLFNNLEHNRRIQQLKYETNIDEVCAKLSADDYFVGINAPLNEFSYEIINKLVTEGYEYNSDEVGNVSLIIDGSGNILKKDTNLEKTKIQLKVGKHNFYLEKSDKNGSLIQFDYHNYSMVNDANIHMVVYSTYYDCVIDVINIGIWQETVWVTHNN